MNVRLICIAGLARCLQLLAAGNCGSTQTNQSEVSIKIRGGRPGVEIKGLVTVCRSELVPFAPYVELWCKWRLQASALEMTKRMIIQKTRWIRTYDTSRAAIVEIPLQADGTYPSVEEWQAAIKLLANPLQRKGHVSRRPSEK